MIELIFELLNNFIDWYQQFMGIPEGISYAIFGAKKKKRRAKTITGVGKLTPN